ncbi:hypothetical protein ACFLTZ_05975 [Chloroflexota bacterium]
MSMQPLEETSEETGEDGGESQEQLDAAFKKLSDLIGEGKDGSLVTFGKAELSLLQKILSTGTEEYRKQQFWRMLDFADEDTAQDHVAAYYEALELGMDTSLNVALAFSMCSANRKGPRTNLLAQLLDAVQHGKWANHTQGRSRNSGGNSKNSPLAG